MREPIEPEEPILRLVTAVSDNRTDVDWEESERSATEEQRGLVRQLRALARIVAALQADCQLDSGVAASQEELRIPGQWGRLEIIDRIASGEFGDVVRARDPQLDREVALKLLRRGKSAATEFASFASEVVREGRLLARVNHPNVARVFGAESHDGRVGVWMELIRGKDLEELLATQGRFAAEEATRIGQDLCRALAAVHGAGMLHRDLKTRNVMREEGGRIVLTDFGTARELSDKEEAWDSTGTPLYMAPELFAGAQATAQSDIYSLGVLLFRLVTGRYPVAGRNYDEVCRAHREGRRTSLADLRPDLPESFVRAIESAIAPQPDARYESAGAFERALAAIHGYATTEATPSAATTSTAGWRLNRALVGAVASAVLIAGLVFAWRFWPGGSYDVQAALYRVRGTSIEPLLPGATIAPGDRLLLEFAGSVDLHVYVLSQDDRGESYLLFPMSRSDLKNPVPAGGPHRLPGSRDGVQMAWTVTSSGGREHLVIVADPHRRRDFEADIHDLDRPESRLDESGYLSDGAGTGADGSSGSRPYARVPDRALSRLRGIGGVVKQPLPAPHAQVNSIFKEVKQLSMHAQSVRGTWVRQIDLEYARP